jgi:hypothetical protein
MYYKTKISVVSCLVFPLCCGTLNDPDTEMTWTVKWFLTTLSATLITNTHPALRGGYSLNIYA